MRRQTQILAASNGTKADIRKLWPIPLLDVEDEHLTKDEMTAMLDKAKQRLKAKTV